MPYPQLEELTSRRREKVALFLTAENMAGLFAIDLPAYIATLHTALILRVLILIAAAVLGVMLTSDIHGMAFWERAVCWARGQARRRVLGAVIRPAEFTAVPVVPGDRALPLGGPLRRVKGGTASPASLPRRVGAVRTAAVPRYRGQTAPAAAGVPGSPMDHRELPEPASRAMASPGQRNGQVAPAETAMAVVVEGDDAM